MKTRASLVIIASALAVLGGCVAVPVDSGYYAPAPAYYGPPVYYGPPAYYGPSIHFDFYGGRHRHRHR